MEKSRFDLFLDIDFFLFLYMHYLLVELKLEKKIIYWNVNKNSVINFDQLLMPVPTNVVEF